MTCDGRQAGARQLRERSKPRRRKRSFDFAQDDGTAHGADRGGPSARSARSGRQETGGRFARDDKEGRFAQDDKRGRALAQDDGCFVRDDGECDGGHIMGIWFVKSGERLNEFLVN